MIVFDKDKIKEQLGHEDVFQLLQEFGGEPQYTNFGFTSTTICHNQPGEGSRKLYFYFNSGLFICYTGCDDGYFDIFQLVIKVAKIQWNKNFSLYDAIKWIAYRFGFSGEDNTDDELSRLPDWKILSNRNKYQEININNPRNGLELKEFDTSVLDRFHYDIKIQPWIDDNISQEVLDFAKIGYYPGGEQITIPHYDKDGNFIGLRGRSLIKEEAENYGKYRPLRINKILYAHPLGLNLYGLNWAKNPIKIMKKAIVAESEKSVLQYMSYFGIENSIAVACCGSSISSAQINLLKEAGAQEIIIAFDRQFKEVGDDEFKHLTKNLTKISNKNNSSVLISLIFDKNMITSYKASPLDEGKEKFLKLYNERIYL